MTDPQQRWLERALRRKQLYLRLTWVGVAAGIAIGAWTLWRTFTEADFSPGLHWVLVVLVLLNARQNLRQYRWALAAEALQKPR